MNPTRGSGRQIDGFFELGNKLWHTGFATSIIHYGLATVPILKGQNIGWHVCYPCPIFITQGKEFGAAKPVGKFCNDLW